MTTNIREPVFAGKFYPENKTELESTIQRILNSEHDKINRLYGRHRLIGAILPHAGYVFSGHHAVHVYEILKESKQDIETFVIVNPNHTGLGMGDVNVSGAPAWKTPLGSISTDVEFVDALQMTHDENAHRHEHSGEVLLPFLQYFIPEGFRIVMITMNSQTPETALHLAQEIKKAVEKTSRKIFIMASSDFSHFESPEAGFKKDQFVIDQILGMDTTGIYQQVNKHHVTACGYGPVMTLTAYSNFTSSSPKMEVLSRGHSGEVSPSQRVVNYVSFLCYE